MKKLSPQQTKRALIFLSGFLLVLLGVYSQVSQQNQKSASSVTAPRDRELLPRLRASLVSQSRNLQRCWLQSAQSHDEQIWQVFVEVKSSGQVSRFQVLNSENVDEATRKCLTELGYRMRFPTFEGENFSFTIPIRMAKETASENP